MGRYLLTGAAGFIASRVADSLLKDGHEVVGLGAGTAAASPDVPLASRDANRTASSRSSRLLLATPSVPKPAGREPNRRTPCDRSHNSCFPYAYVPDG